jgi:hypothetical protein
MSEPVKLTIIPAGASLKPVLNRRISMLVVFGGTLLAQSPTIRVEGVIVDAVTGVPVEGARVLLVQERPRGVLVVAPDLWRKAALPAQTPPPDAQRMVVETGPDGHFQFIVAAPTGFMIFAYREGYADVVPGRGGPGRFLLGADQHRTDLILKIQPQNSVAGRLLDDETREPIRGLVVRAYIAGPAPHRVPAQSKPSGADGRYGLSALPPGDYLLRVEPPASPSIKPARPDEDLGAVRLSDYLQSWYPGVATAGEALPVKVTGGVPIDGVDFRLKKSPHYVIRARITGGEGNARVTLLRRRYLPLDPPIEFVTSGAFEIGSSFEIAPLVDGTYVLLAEAGALYAQESVTLEGTHADHVELHLRPGVLVTCSIEPSAAQESSIELRPLDRARGKFDIPFSAGEEGVFRSQPLPPGRYVLSLRGNAVVARVHYNNTLAPHGHFHLDPGYDRHHLVITLAERPAAIQANVRQGLRPAAHANVVLVREPVLAESLRDALKEAQSDDDGRVQFDNLAPGTYRLAAFPAEILWRELPELVTQLSSARDLSLAEGEVKQVEVPLN